MSVRIGDEFQRATKYVRGKMEGGYLDWSKKPGTYKHYPNSTKIKLIVRLSYFNQRDFKASMVILRYPFVGCRFNLQVPLKTILP